jgi:glutamyl-tRNA synthetase
MERLRFAPSPTGPLHIGGLRTALFNYLYAKQNNGKFILRIEDTDKKRKVNGSEKHIIDSLKWAEINFDEGPLINGPFGPYRQSERASIYSKYVQILLVQNKAYYAFDLNEDLEDARKKKEKEGSRFVYGMNSRKNFKNSLTLSLEKTTELIKKNVPYVIRLKINQKSDILCKDILRGEVKFNYEELEDKILIKSDGSPTYHFANVVDDYLMKITTVIRGEEWLSSFPIHLTLYKYFNWVPPKFIHLPLILNPSGKGKLSKRDGIRNGYPVYPIGWIENEILIPGFKEKGFTGDSLLNYIAQLGWSFFESNEMCKLTKLIKIFNVENLQKGGARFDYIKALWINSKHIQNTENKTLLNYTSDEFKMKIKKYDQKTIYSILELVKNRIEVIPDIEKKINLIIDSPIGFNERDLNKVINKNSVPLLKSLSTIFSDEKNMISKDFLITYCNENKIKFGDIMQLLRISIIGELSGPDIIEVIKIIGLKRTIERIDFLNNTISNFKI